MIVLNPQNIKHDSSLFQDYLKDLHAPQSYSLAWIELWLEQNYDCNVFTFRFPESSLFPMERKEYHIEFNDPKQETWFRLKYADSI